MYKDIITSEKYPCFYILMNKKFFVLYDLIFKSIIQIITQNNLYTLNFKTKATDDEFALLKVVKEV